MRRPFRLRAPCNRRVVCPIIVIEARVRHTLQVGNQSRLAEPDGRQEVGVVEQLLRERLLRKGVGPQHKIHVLYHGLQGGTL